MNIIKKFWNNRWILRSLFHTIYFNFHYLPFKQAIYLPILLYKPTFLELNGIVRICDVERIRFGMITLGRYTVPLYPNSGITFQNRGGEIVLGEIVQLVMLLLFQLVRKDY